MKRVNVFHNFNNQISIPLLVLNKKITLNNELAMNETKNTQKQPNSGESKQQFSVDISLMSNDINLEIQMDFEKNKNKSEVTTVSSQKHCITVAENNWT